MNSHSPQRGGEIILVIALAVAPSIGRADADMSKWRQSREIVVDTTAAGADVPGDVRDIPIPLRLDITAGAMPGASANGADIRFTQPDGRPVPHQIERWEAGRRAEVWVLLDEVKGNTRATALRMYWGNPSAVDASDGTRVFDTAKGYLGVWHLAEPGNRRAAGYRDSSGNQAHGTGMNLADSAGVEGVIAGGQNFQAVMHPGEGAMIRIDPAKKQTFSVKNEVTLTAWVKVDQWENFFETIVSKGDIEWRLSRITRTDTLEFCLDWFRKSDGAKIKAGGGVGGKLGIADGQWHFIVGTTGRTHDLYVDGRLDQSSPPVSPEGAAKPSDYDVLIGANSQQLGGRHQPPDKAGKPRPPRNFRGVLDEIQVLNTSRNADWVKLSYESQRPDQKLVTFSRFRRN